MLQPVCSCKAVLGLQPSAHAPLASASTDTKHPVTHGMACVQTSAPTHDACRYYDSDAQPPNSILQRAILNFINKETATLSNLPDAELQLKKKALNSGDDDDGAKDDKAADDDEEPTTVQHAYEFNVAPPMGHWVELSNGIRFMRCVQARAGVGWGARGAGREMGGCWRGHAQCSTALVRLHTGLERRHLL